MGTFAIDGLPLMREPIDSNPQQLASAGRETQHVRPVAGWALHERGNEMNTTTPQLTAVLMLAVEGMENHVLAAMNLALSWQGHIPRENIAFQAALEARLIRDDGAPVAKDELISAVSYEINRRLDTGTFS